MILLPLLRYDEAIRGEGVFIMTEFQLSCCSTADLTADELEARNVTWTPFQFTMNGTEYPDDLGRTLSFHDFYRALREGAEVHTSQVSIGQFTEYFSALAEKGQDILHLSFSSGLSGAFQSATAAAQIVMEHFPALRIAVVDTLCASTGYGMFVLAAADRRDSGMTLDEAAAWCRENRLYLRHVFFSTDLSAYIRGGRISKAAGHIGSLLGICPLLDMDGAGRLICREKIRGKKRVISRIADVMAETARNGTNYNGRCMICHSDCAEDAEAAASLIRERFPKLDGEITMHSVGTVIGAHTGIGTVAVFFWSEKPRDCRSRE